MKPATEPWLIGIAIVFFLCVTSLVVSYFMGDSALYDAVGAATSRTVNRGVPGLDEEAAKAQILGTPGEVAWGGAASTAFWVDPSEDMAVLLLTQLMPVAEYVREGTLYFPDMTLSPFAPKGLKA